MAILQLDTNLSTSNNKALQLLKSTLSWSLYKLSMQVRYDKTDRCACQQLGFPLLLLFFSFIHLKAQVPIYLMSENLDTIYHFNLFSILSFGFCDHISCLIFFQVSIDNLGFQTQGLTYTCKQASKELVLLSFFFQKQIDFNPNILSFSYFIHDLNSTLSRI